MSNILPVATYGSELSINVGVDYTAMSLAPLEYSPYTRRPGMSTIGYAGIVSVNGSFEAIAAVRDNDDIESSLYVMNSWLKPITATCFPEARLYSTELLDEIISESSDNGPLAFIQLEGDTRGDRNTILAAQTSLGQLSIDAKSRHGFQPAAIQEHKKDRWDFRLNTLKDRISFGVTEYEALVVGAALMLRLFNRRPELEDPSKSTPSIES